MDELVCRACGRSIRLACDDNGWPSLRDASSVTLDHADCLRAPVAPQPRERRGRLSWRRRASVG